MPRRLSRAHGLALLAALLLPLTALPVAARVEMTVDATSLNEVAVVMAPTQVRVPLTEARAITVQIQDLRVTGFDPAEGEHGGGVRVSCRLKVPELTVDTPVEARLALQVVDKSGKKTAVLRFEKILVPLPVAGSMDVSSFIPVIPLPIDGAWPVQAETGNFVVRTTLTEASVGAKNLRLAFEIQVAKAP